jgi:hypothetical protein
MPKARCDPLRKLAADPGHRGLRGLADVSTGEQVIGWAKKFGYQGVEIDMAIVTRNRDLAFAAGSI